MESSQNEPEVKVRATADFGDSDSDERSTEEMRALRKRSKVLRHRENPQIMM